MSDPLSSSLIDMLNIGKNDSIYLNAENLVKNDYDFHSELIRLRVVKGLTRKKVASRMGVTTKWLKKFESYSYDPKLSELRRYALAINASYSHQIIQKEKDS